MTVHVSYEPKYKLTHSLLRVLGLEHLIGRRKIMGFGDSEATYSEMHLILNLGTLNKTKLFYHFHMTSCLTELFVF